MYAHIDYNEASRIRHHLRVYLPGNPDVVEDPDMGNTESIPVMIYWSENPPKPNATGYLRFDFDEPGIPPLHVVAKSDGADFDGHTYTYLLGHEVGVFLKRADESDCKKSGRRFLTLYIENEISYEFSDMPTPRSDAVANASAYPY